MAVPITEEKAIAGQGSGESRRASLARRIFAAMAAIAVASCVLVSVASAFVYQKSVVEDAQAGLRRECELVTSTLNATNGDNDSEVQALLDLDFSDVRVTLVSKTGKVLYDSLVEASTLPNHKSRPEIAQALKSGTGESERDSSTVGYLSVYHAERLKSGDVIRLSEDRDGILRVIGNELWPMIGIVVIVVAAAWIASRRFSALLVKPILAIDTSSGNAASPYQELDPLVSHLNEQQAELQKRMNDIVDADAMRQEFTANVTHELKTPIAAISGASELLRDGLVRPEDVQEFASRIYGDAQRLSSLVSDILTLSKLDESERVGDQALFGEPSQVDLYTVAQDVADRLEEKAAKANVSLRVQGASVTISGYPRLLDEMIRNLCDNAIRYNRTGGSVHVFVLPVNGHPTIRVSDTGVGISPQDQAKVFERFYRVDKSRSRETGGTGLGLAIVKHAAALHKATIDLDSELGRGTTITVTFPAESK
ncbi:MAG: ATP-binding protein [Parafannyhessea sp.]|uniref:sensor histidine kinase n=1 Tax=Parafannyhessea sp. TaxID=2847324 RepID=UPI003F12386A